MRGANDVGLPGKELTLAMIPCREDRPVRRAEDSASFRARGADPRARARARHRRAGYPAQGRQRSLLPRTDGAADEYRPPPQLAPRGRVDRAGARGERAAPSPTPP